MISQKQKSKTMKKQKPQPIEIFSTTNKPQMDFVIMQLEIHFRKEIAKLFTSANEKGTKITLHSHCDNPATLRALCFWAGIHFCQSQLLSINNY